MACLSRPDEVVKVGHVEDNDLTQLHFFAEYLITKSANYRIFTSREDTYQLPESIGVEPAGDYLTHGGFSSGKQTKT